MSNATVDYREGCELPKAELVSLYRDVGWMPLSRRPDLIVRAMRGSDVVLTAWDQNRLIGLANTISDGALVVFFSHLLVRPSHQRRGIGSELVRRLRVRYRGFNQQVLISEPDASDFYRAVGFLPVEPKAHAFWVWQAVEPGTD